MLVEIILFLSIIIGNNFISTDLKIENKKSRITILISSVVVLVLIFSPIQYINKWILNNIYDIEKRRDYKGITDMGQYYAMYGFFGGMYGQVLENRVQKPDNYDEQLINEELKDLKQEKETMLGKPNIIVVFSESFWDVDQLDEVEFNTKVTPNFQKLKEEGLFFNMISPSYGGVSANVEYEFLTGSNLMYFNRGYVPYLQLYNNKTYYDRPSIISELKNNGYRTKIVTCASPNLFNCGRFYKYLKVDDTEFVTKVDKKDMKGLYISDEYVTNRIINEFENKSENEKLFYMTMTMQAHMPYLLRKYNDYDVDIVKSDLSEGMNNTLKSYAQGIYDADKQLGRLYDYIKSIDEPTIIVFYGDHLPYLDSIDGDLFQKLKYFNTEDEVLNLYRKYNTQSLILANFDIKQEKNTKYLGPDLLSSYILNNMDIEVSDYYKWLYYSKDTIGAANFAVSIDQNGKLYRTTDLSENMKKIYNMRRNIEYKYFVK